MPGYVCVWPKASSITQREASERLIPLSCCHHLAYAVRILHRSWASLPICSKVQRMEQASDCARSPTPPPMAAVLPNILGLGESSHPPQLTRPLESTLSPTSTPSTPSTLPTPPAFTRIQAFKYPRTQPTTSLPVVDAGIYTEHNSLRRFATTTLFPATVRLPNPLPGFPRTVIRRL